MSLKPIFTALAAALLYVMLMCDCTALGAVQIGLDLESTLENVDTPMLASPSETPDLPEIHDGKTDSLSHVCVGSDNLSQQAAVLWTSTDPLVSCRIRAEMLVCEPVPMGQPPDHVPEVS